MGIVVEHINEGDVMEPGWNEKGAQFGGEEGGSDVRSPFCEDGARTPERGIAHQTRSNCSRLSPTLPFVFITIAILTREG